MTDQTRSPLAARSDSWRSIHAALVAAQKSSRNAPAYSRWINRPIGRVFAATAYKASLSPNAISAIGSVFTFSGIALIALWTPSLVAGLVIAALLVVGYALDSSDGQVARLQGGGSLAGEWLDHVLDAFKVTGFHLAVAVMWLRNPEGWPGWTIAVPLVFTLQASTWFFAITLTDQLLRNSGADVRSRKVDEPAQPVWTSLLGIPADYGFLSLTLLLFGWQDGWRWVYIALAVVNVAMLAARLPVWYRRCSVRS